MTAARHHAEPHAGQQALTDPLTDPRPGGSGYVVPEPQAQTSMVPAIAHPGGVLAAFQDDEWGDVEDGLVGMEHIGFSMPRLISDMRPGGGWTDETTGEVTDHLSFVWLTSAPGRAYWSKAFGKGESIPDCRSVDMVTPDPDSPAVQANTCAECPHSKWGSHVGSDGEFDGGQACSMRINVLVYDTESNHLARVGFGSTAIKKVRSYLSSLKANVPPRPPVSVVTEVKLEQVEKDGMRWLEPVLTVGERLDRKDATPLLRLRDEFLSQWKTAMAADLAAPDGDDRSAATPIPDEGKPFYPSDGSEPF